MSYKPFGSNDPETVKHWSDMVDVLFQQNTAFKEGRDVGTKNGASVFLTKTDLEKTNEAGDRIRLTTTAPFTGKGTLGDRNIVGRGEKLRTSNVDLVIDQIRHEYETPGAMSEKRTVLKHRNIGRDGLADWMARKIDGARMIVMAGEVGVNSYERIRWDEEEIAEYEGIELTPPDAEHHFFAGSASSVGALSSTDVPTASLLARMKRILADMDNPPLPFMLDGEPFYVLYHDEAILQLLKEDAKFREVYLQAVPRSFDNPIVKGSWKQVDGFIFRYVPQLIKPKGASTPGAVRRMIIAGAEDVLEAFGKGEYAYDGRFEWYEEKGDRGKKKAVTVGAMYGGAKNTWTENGTKKWRNSVAVDVWVGATA